MRSDLHVHTKASGMFNLPGLKHLCQECYNEPLEVYDLLKRRGMSAITVTDHDSIEGSEALRSFSDFFLSEEVSVRMPSGTEAHLGVYNLTERDHLEIKRRANDFVSLLMYLTERKLFFSVNHVFSGLTGRREADDFAWFESYVPAYEARNGQMWRKSNECAAQLAARLDKIAVAGSDATSFSPVCEQARAAWQESMEVTADLQQTSSASLAHFSRTCPGRRCFPRLPCWCLSSPRDTG